MLSYLKVREFALIENIEVEFRRGLNILTGETGAGKTVLIGAIGLLLGDRADSLQVRQGAAEAVFACSIDLSSLPEARAGIEQMGYLDGDESELMLGRTVSAQGKSRCTVNGRISPVSALSEVGELLVDVHGQNAHQALLKTASHIDYLDRFAGGAHLDRLAEYRGHYAKLKSLEGERREIESRGGGSEREVELLASEIERIDKADIRPGEIEELEPEASRLRHSRELWELGSLVRTKLAAEGSTPITARELLLEAEKDLSRMSNLDSGLNELFERVRSLAFEAEDIASEVADYCCALDTDPARLEEVESRLNLLRDLCRKYGGNLEAAMEYRDDAARKLDLLTAGRDRLSEIEREISGERSRVGAGAERLFEGRKKSGRTLEKAVVKELAQLELAGADFKVGVSRRAEQAGEATGRPVDGFGPTGSDSVEFLFSPEEKETPRPLRRIASGGEMSRVMLALKIVLASADRIPILIFDEVDSGIGGETAGKVGEKLFELTRFHQVFCVTHIPQIATFSDWQYRVSKRESRQRSRTDIELLEGEGRVEEMCRMLGDSSGRKVTLEHARDILERAEKKKRAG